MEWSQKHKIFVVIHLLGIVKLIFGVENKFTQIIFNLLISY